MLHDLAFKGLRIDSFQNLLQCVNYFKFEFELICCLKYLADTWKDLGFDNVVLHLGEDGFDPGQGKNLELRDAALKGLR